MTNRNVLRLFSATAPWFKFDERDVWTLFHSFAFDFSVWEIWGALLHGGKLVIVPWLVSRDPDAFLGLLERERRHGPEPDALGLRPVDRRRRRPHRPARLWRSAPWSSAARRWNPPCWRAGWRGAATARPN